MENIFKLSNDALLETIKQKRGEESRATIEVLHLLREVDRRRLFVARSYSSLFEFATKFLGYSEDSAYRRIQAMRLLRDFPQYESKVQSGELQLSAASTLQTFFRNQKDNTKRQAGLNPAQLANGTFAPKLSPELGMSGNVPEVKTGGALPLSQKDKATLIEQACGKSTREVEKLVAQQSPEVFVAKERERVVATGQTEIRFVADDELMALLNRVKDLCGGKNAYPNYADLLKLLAKAYLAKKDPQEKTSVSAKVTSAQNRAPRSRYIPAKVRQQVLLRSGGQCQYTDPRTKRRCECRRNLEVDHIRPYSLAGSNEAHNLQAICRVHNQFKAQDVCLLGVEVRP